jgi:hypothetical protein
MRRGRVIGGIVLLCAATALSAPYALAAGGSAVDQGYPCATAAPAAPGTNGAGGCATSGVAGTSHTNTPHSQAPAPEAAQVAPAQTGGTLPFTGVQLGVFGVLGVMLIGGGLVLRASGRSRTDS